MRLSLPLRRLAPLLFAACAAALAPAAARAAAINVDGFDDTLNTDGVCSIREAVVNANSDAATWPDCAAGSGPDTINLPAGTITFTIPNTPHPFNEEQSAATGDLDLNGSLTVNGHPAGTTINANDVDRIFDINPAAAPAVEVFINLLHITNGLINSDGGGLRIFPNATVYVDRSTVSNNKITVNDGGGIYNLGGTLHLTNSTVSGNETGLLYGGIGSSGTTTLTNCTVTDNRTTDGTPTRGQGVGGGQFTIRNTVIAGNGPATSPDVEGAFTSLGYNIIGRTTDSFGNPTAIITPAAGDQIDVGGVTVNLGPLQSNGGPTPTHELLPGSIAVDQGESSGAATDQRGLTRPCDLAAVTNAAGGDGADVGAFEVQGACASPNEPPAAADDDYQMDQDTTLSVPAPGVLANDTDPDADSLTAALVGPAPPGTFAFNSDGSFQYQPPASFTGVVSFTYRANDGQEDSNVATVTITVADTEGPDVNASVAAGALWPPNHNLVNVGLEVSADDNSGDPVQISVAVYSDEDDLTSASGQHSPDARDIAPGTLRLRAERDGSGDGRVYLIVVTATDSSNNTSHACLTVVVPHDGSAGAASAVAQQAQAALAYCEANGAPPPAFFLVGDGPTVGPKQ